MFLKTLFLRHFRNYKELTVSFSPGINCIQGENAQGKTNLLEAIYFLSTGRSFRTHHLADLIYQGEPFFYLEAEFVKEGISQTVRASFDGHLRKVQHNQTSYNHFSSLLGLLPTVIFAPEDVALIQGAPSERRRFLDLHIAQIDPLYVHHLIRYLKSMKQRNYLLRQAQETTLLPWEEIMAHSGSYLMQKRSACIQELANPVAKYMQELSRKQETLELHYEPSLPLESDLALLSKRFLEKLHKHRKREIQLGHTLTGPHRDDLVLSITGKPAKIFSSEGQKRSCLAALRLAEWERARELTTSPPILSIDDFGIHLDQKRYLLLQHQMKGLGQVFLTSPHPLGELLPADKFEILIKEGQLSSF